MRDLLKVLVDIGELALVGVEGIRFFNACRDQGMNIINASPYVADWMLLERNSGPPYGRS